MGLSALLLPAGSLPNWDLHRLRLHFHVWFSSLQRADTEQAVCTSAGTPALGFNHSAPAKEGGTGALCHLPAFPMVAASTAAQVGSSHPPCSSGSACLTPAPRRSHLCSQEGNQSCWLVTYAQITGSWLPPMKRSSLAFNVLGERVFSPLFFPFPIPKVTWPDYFKHSWLFPHAPAPLAGTGVFSELG